MSKKIYAVDLCYYTEENVPECGAMVFIRSNIDITKLPTHIINITPKGVNGEIRHHWRLPILNAYGVWGWCVYRY